MFLLKLLFRSMFRFAISTATAALVVCLLLGTQVWQRGNDLAMDGLHWSANKVAEHDLNVLREEVDLAKERFDKSRDRRAALEKALDRLAARREAALLDHKKAKAVLGEIANLLASDRAVLTVSGSSYSRGVVERDADRHLRRYQATAEALPFQTYVRPVILTNGLYHLEGGFYGNAQPEEGDACAIDGEDFRSGIFERD